MGDLGIIVVDMQDEFLQMSEGTKESLIGANRQLLAYAAREDIPVVALEYRGCGRTTRLIRRALQEVPRHVYYEKEHDNGFADTPIEVVLKQCGVKTVCLTGVNASACVKSTAKGALAADFDIITASNLIANGRYFGAEPHEDQYGRWYMDHGQFLSSHRDIIGGDIIESKYLPPPEGFLSRLKNLLA